MNAPHYMIMVGGRRSAYNTPGDHDGSWSTVVACWHRNGLALQKEGWTPWRVVEVRD